LLAENYGTAFQVADFAYDYTAADATFYDWGEVPGLWSPTSPSKDTRFIIGDISNLDLAWLTPFDQAQTVTGKFRTLDSSAVDVPFMRISGLIKQTTGAHYKAFELPLAGGQRFVVIQPDDGYFTSVAQSIDAAHLDSIVAALAPVQVNLAVPKFAFTASTDFGLGLASVKDAADFSGMDGTKDLYVASSGQAASFSISEAGVKSSSVTQVVLDDAHPETWPSYGSISYAFFGGPGTNEAVLGTPFLFVVRDSATGTALFVGNVLDPSM